MSKKKKGGERVKPKKERDPYEELWKKKKAKSKRNVVIFVTIGSLSLLPLLLLFVNVAPPITVVESPIPPITFDGNYTWEFDNPVDYTYPGSLIQVSNNVSSLKLQSVPNPNIYAIFNLNENSGSTFSDSSGNGHDGHTHNMENSDWVSGMIGNGLRFDGNNEYAHCDSNNDGNFGKNDDFSIELWMKPDQSEAQLMVSKRDDTGSQRGFSFGVTSTDLLEVVFRNSASNQLVIRGSTDVFTGFYQHVAFTHNATTPSGVSIYVNGTLESMSTITNTIGSNEWRRDSKRFQISGRDGTHNVFDGIIDEVIVYDNDLNASDFVFRYNSGVGTTEFPTEPDFYPSSDPIISTSAGLILIAPIKNFTINSTEPENTSIVFHVSINSGSTWNYYNITLGSWTTSDRSYDQSNNASVIHANIEDLTTSGIFMVSAILRSNGTYTPELDRIYISI